jgi:ribosomal protein S18 acetylase RimI-like enzyme
MGGIVIRPYRGGDLTFLATLEIQGYEHPWDVNEIAKHTTDLMVGVIDGKIIGYFVLALDGNRVQLLRLIVSPGWRRSGCGTALLEHAVNEVRAFKRITTIVPESNEAAQCFLRRNHFRCVNILKDHFVICGIKEAGYYFLRRLQ